MTSRIDGTTMVPLDIMVKVIGFLFTTGMMVTATGAVWIYKVNDRLERIEHRLGIAEVKPTDLITRAEAYPIPQPQKQVLGEVDHGRKAHPERF